MRTTVTLDDDVVQVLHRRMQETGVSFKRALNEAIRETANRRPAAAFRTATADLGTPAINLDRALQIAAELEDEDANVLLYAVNTASDQHGASLGWLDKALSGADAVGLAWVPLLAFVRLTTKPGIFPTPLRTDQALARVTDWLSAPGAVLVNPTPRHADILAGLLAQVGTGGNLVSDAHLAALALEHRASIVSYDHDFSRFDGVRWDQPDALK